MNSSHKDDYAQAKAAVVGHAVRQLIKAYGPTVIDDLQRYLRLCRKAKALRENGFQARVRGYWQHWLVVIERPSEAETSIRRHTHPSHPGRRREPTHTTPAAYTTCSRLRDRGHQLRRSSPRPQPVLPLTWFE